MIRLQKIRDPTNCSVLLILLIGLSAHAATCSFDQTNGVLAVDYASYLSKHAIVFNKPITDSTSGLTVGNGRVGAVVWNSNGITMQVTGWMLRSKPAFQRDG